MDSLMRLAKLYLNQAKAVNFSKLHDHKLLDYTVMD